MRTEYKITKDKCFTGQRFDTYTIEKVVTKGSGEKEFRYGTWIPFRDGDISKVDLNTLDFQKPITQDEWEQLPRGISYSLDKRENDK